MPHRFGSLLALVALTVASFGCSSPDPTNMQAVAATGNEREVAIVHEACAVDSQGASRIDANGDGRPDIVHVMDGPREVCRVVDLNLDGSVDAFIFYGPDGLERRRESDYDRDGRADEIAILVGGVVVRKDRETNYDDKLDTWDYYEGARLARRERDSDGDGLVDQWWQFTDPNDPRCALVARDQNGDGKPEPTSTVDLCAASKPAATPPVAPPAPATAPTTPMEGPAGGPAKDSQ